MNYIVLLKQVPDIKNIPNEAWDWEKGTLKRSLLDNICNELDKQALAMALRLRENRPGRIIGLTMGPPFAEDILRYALSVGADEAVLLTDRKFGGADTAATAYPLGQAIRKVERELFGGNVDYLILSGMQSVDGDTAQVPPQVAEELGIAHIAYATDLHFDNGKLIVQRITHSGSETVTPDSYPCLVTATKWAEPPFPSFARTRWAYSQKIIRWGAAEVNADESRIGLGGSRTTVYRIFSPRELGKKCVFDGDVNRLVQLVREAYDRKVASAQQREKDEPAYCLPEGKKPTYTGEVWVYAEQDAGEVNPASLELLGRATVLARSLGEKVGAVLVGHNVRGLATQLIACGADRVYAIDHALLEAFLPVPYTRVISELVENYRPQMMLFGATPLGRELAPRVAYRSRSGLTADCTALDIMDFERGKQDFVAVLRQTRPALGGNIMASIITQNSPVQMATARPGVMRALPPDMGRTGEIIEHFPDIKEADLKTRIISSEVREKVASLGEAGVIACGGAGCGTRDNYERYVYPLAESLGKFLGETAMVAASRAAVELGFIDRSHQVGQTGQTVKPRVYVAMGVSGAVQHLTGMQNSDVIIAINRDPQAPIFRVADFGVVGSIEEVVPRLLKALDSKGE